MSEFHSILVQLSVTQIGIDNQHLLLDSIKQYVLALMLRAKAFDTQGGYRLLHHNFTQYVWLDY